jgi:peptidoglycan-associated lipoprotein
VLRVQPWSQIQVAGHCDERGTEEYNLVLGQRRADVARSYLVALGAQTEQVNTVSYGDLIPTVMGNDEEAWAWNRRSEFSANPLELFGYIPSSVEMP